MTFKRADQILSVDPRYVGFVVTDANGVRPMDLTAHHAIVAQVVLRGTPPDDVREAFDRARNLFLYAYFDYDLLVNAEIQALGSVELALRLQLGGAGERHAAQPCGARPQAWRLSQTIA